VTGGGSNKELAAKFHRAAGSRPAAEAGGGQSVNPTKARLSKFTVNLDANDAEDFDAVVLAARRTLGRRVDKSEIVRAVIKLLGSDATLRQQVWDLVHLADDRHPEPLQTTTSLRESFPADAAQRK
jgi:hypothetical protein